MLTREEGKELYRRYRMIRTGIRSNPQAAYVCLICESIHVAPVADSQPPAMECMNCGFRFLRYTCHSCGEPVDGRDPDNPGCRKCGWRVCVCSACSPGECSEHEQRLQQLIGLNGGTTASSG